MKREGNFTPQSQSESASHLKSESEGRDVVADTGSGIDERRISQLRARLCNEELLHALLRLPEWLESLARTPDDLRLYRDLLSRWQADGCPDLESWLAEDFPEPLQAEPVQTNDNMVRCYVERQVPILQLVDGKSFVRVAYPEFRYVEWSCVAEAMQDKKEVDKECQTGVN